MALDIYFNNCYWFICMKNFFLVLLRTFSKCLLFFFLAFSSKHFRIPVHWVRSFDHNSFEKITCFYLNLWYFILQVATWVDETLSSVASKLEHTAQTYSELQGERIVSLHCCALYTCAQLENNLYWWWVSQGGASANAFCA